MAKLNDLVLEHSDRKSVVQGKSVDLGGRRIIKKKKEKNKRTAGTRKKKNRQKRQNEKHK